MRSSALSGLTRGLILLSDGFDIEGAKFFRMASERGLEGMVSKRLLPYRSARTRACLRSSASRSGTSQSLATSPAAPLVLPP
jgi:ATP-dependent DNA ligase